MLKNIKKSSIADLANAATGGFLNLAFPNLMNSLLSSDDEFEAESIFSYLMKDIRSKNILLIFDHIDYYGKLAYAVMLLFLQNISADNDNKYKILIVLDNHSLEDSNYSFFNFFSPKIITLNNPKLEDEELLKLEIQSYINFSDKLSLDQLIRMKNKSLKEKLLELSEANNININLDLNLIYTSVILGRYATIDEFYIFLPNETDFEVNQQINSLKEKGLFTKIEKGKEILFQLNPVYRETIEKELPKFLVDNRQVILSKYLNKNAPFDYYKKFLNYKSMQYHEESFISGIQYYCMASRNEIDFNTEEMSNLNNYFMNENPVQKQLFLDLVEIYELYNQENYDASLTRIDIIIDQRNLDYKNLKQGLTFPYPAEILGEIFYLKALCLARFSNSNYQPSIESTLKSLKLIQKHIFPLNSELSIRLKEAIFILLVTEKEKGDDCQNDSSKLNHNIGNYFFSIYSDYLSEIKNSNLRNYRLWRCRYAFHLSKINSIDGIMDKALYFEEAYRIMKEYKELNPNNYIRISNNISVDFLWRSNYEKSLAIIEDASAFIKENSPMEHWGNLLINSWFIRLYCGMSSPQLIMAEYKNLIDSNSPILERVHEKDLVNINISILFAANNDLQTAFSLLQENRENIRTYYSKYIHLTNKAALYYLTGNFNRAVKFENFSYKIYKKYSVPYFTPTFIEERHKKLLNIYSNEEEVHNVLEPLVPLNSKRLATGYTSDLYMKLMIFSDVNYWAN